MAKKTTKQEPSSGRSKVWDSRLPKGVQHTIYAPANFFELWVGDDSPLKAVVNEYLVSVLPKEAPGAVAAKDMVVDTEFVLVGDDDI